MLVKAANAIVEGNAAQLKHQAAKAGDFCCKIGPKLSRCNAAEIVDDQQISAQSHVASQ
jgi:hypothetical protein